MIWTSPCLFSLVPIAALVFYLVYRCARRRGRALAQNFSSDMLSALTLPRSSRLSTLKGTAFALGVLSLVCVFSGPRYGTEKETKNTLGRDVFVLLDVSDSMTAEDVAPDRLSVAKLDIEDLLDEAVGDRVGLIAFAGSAQVEIPLTTDRVFFRELLRKLDASTVSLGGTALGDAIRLALSRFGDSPDRERVIILITDGEDHDSLPLEAAENAKELNIPIFTIAIGDLAGSPIPIFDAGGRRVGYKEFDGEQVLSKPDVAALKEIAKISGGRYYYADADLDLAAVYRTSVDSRKRSVLEEKTRVVLKDRYQPFLAFGILMFATSYFLPSRTKRSSNRAVSPLGLLALCGALFVNGPALGSEANDRTPTLDENAAEEELGTRAPQNKREEIRALNDALQAATEGDREKADKILESLSDAKTSAVASRANYNLGASAVKDALEKAKDLEASFAPQPVATPTDGAQTDASQPQKDAVALYREDKKKRDALKNELSADLRGARRRFYRASQDQKQARASVRAADAIENWTREEDAKAREAELGARSTALSAPNDRSRWFEEELSQKIAKLSELRDAPTSAARYQTLFEESRALDAYDADVDFIAQGAAERLLNGPATDQGPSALGAAPIESKAPARDEVGAQKITAASQDVLARLNSAADALKRYDAKTSARELREAKVGTTTFTDVPASYEELVLRLDAEQEQTLKTLENASADKYDAKELEQIYWDGASLKRSLDEALRKADMAIASAPDDGSLETPTLEPEKDELASEEDAAKEETVSEEDAKEELAAEEDDIEFEPNDEEKTVERSREEKVLESAKIAAARRDELNDALENVLNAASQDESSDASALNENRKKIAQIVQEIAKPLKDENKQNNDQNKDNKDDKNKDQNKDNKDDKNKDQNKDDKDDKNKDQNKDNKDDQNKDEQNEDQDQQEPEEQKQDQDRENKEDDKKDDGSPQEQNLEESQEPKEQKDAPQEEEKTEEQKEAEALVRQVERRQKDAEAQRQALRRAFKRRERSGKDW